MLLNTDKLQIIIRNYIVSYDYCNLNICSQPKISEIFLDAIEIFFVDSHQNGATSWIPKVLPENVKVIITFTKG